MTETKKVYQAPRVVEYGPIGDHTFFTPSGTYKGCKPIECINDNYGEPSHLPS
jgi:hypothetical protein